MKNFAVESNARLHILRLDPGDDLLECVNQLIQEHGVKNGAVISGIGTLDRCVLHMVTTTSYPAVEHFERWEDTPLELASVSGVIAGGVPHLHCVVSDCEKAYAGHVEPGCRILYLGELLILELEAGNLERIKNENGINVLAQ